MKPAPPANRCGRALGAAAAVTATAVALATGCGRHNPAAETTYTTSATPTVSAPELLRLWETHPLPCDHPVGVSDRPADPYNLLETGMWPSTADVASRLGAVTAIGGHEFILGRLQMLGAVVIQTQSEIADRVNTGTHGLNGVAGDPGAETVIRDESTRAVKLRHDNYVAAVDHVIGELEIGAILPSAQIGHRYRLERVCPHR